MRSLSWRILTILISATAAITARADEAQVRAALQRAFPQQPIQEILPTLVPGILEAAINGQVLYVTQDGQFVFAGPLIDVKNNQNLTAARLEKLNEIPFENLPLDLAFKWVKGSGARKIAIFEDPDCPYCKVLDQTLKTMDNLTVFVFLFPIEQLHPEAIAKSRAVWCAPNPSKAWDEVVQSGIVPAISGPCNDPIAKIAEFAKQHRINGTPTSILANGRRLVGAIPRVEFEQHLDSSTRP